MNDPIEALSRWVGERAAVRRSEQSTRRKLLRAAGVSTAAIGCSMAMNSLSPDEALAAIDAGCDANHPRCCARLSSSTCNRFNSGRCFVVQHYRGNCTLPGCAGQPFQTCQYKVVTNRLCPCT